MRQAVRTLVAAAVLCAAPVSAQVVTLSGDTQASRPSLHAVPVKLTPKGAGLASKPEGAAAFGTIPNGTITVG